MKKTVIIVVGLLLCAAAVTVIGQKKVLSPKEERREVREKRRAERIANYEKFMDSLVLSRNFQFNPTTFQRQPAGPMRQIMNPAFNVGMWDGTADITLPYIKGYVPPYYVTIINYTVSDLQGYITEQTHEGWMVTFSTSLFSASTYTFTFEIFSRTGGATGSRIRCAVRLPLRRSPNPRLRRGFFPVQSDVRLMKHSVFSTCGALSFIACAAVAQTPQYTLETSAADSVPQTTIVPVQQAPVQVVEHTTVYEEPAAGMDRAQRRAYKARVYAAKIDSLVQSRDYMFFPNSMQQLPGGMIRSIYADYFFFGVFVDHVEVHLPTERGITQYVEMLNFDSMSVRDYRAARVQWGWSVSFNISDGNTLYHADFAVSTATGETVLTLLTPDVTMRYVGWLWNKRVNDPRYRRMD